MAPALEALEEDGQASSASVAAGTHWLLPQSSPLCLCPPLAFTMSLIVTLVTGFGAHWIRQDNFFTSKSFTYSHL